jgi:hypothetical protein
VRPDFEVPYTVRTEWTEGRTVAKTARSDERKGREREALLKQAAGLTDQTTLTGVVDAIYASALNFYRYYGSGARCSG